MRFFLLYYFNYFIAITKSQTPGGNQYLSHYYDTISNLQQRFDTVMTKVHRLQCMSFCRLEEHLEDCYEY